MEYNKESFLAGIAVGRALKGWGGGGTGGDVPGGDGPGGTGGCGAPGCGFGIIFGAELLFEYGGKVLENPAIVFEILTEEA